MATVKILVRNIDSDQLSLIEINDEQDAVMLGAPITRQSLKANGFEVVDDHEAALKRLYTERRREDRPYQAVRGFASRAAFLRIG